MSSDKIKDILEQSRYTVCLCGKNLEAEEVGEISYRYGQDSYHIEMRYGSSADELFTALMFTMNTARFYNFYKSEMLSHVMNEPPKVFQQFERLERLGKINLFITNNIFAFEKRSGCKNVIEVLGNIEHHYCPRCKNEYDLNYIMNSSNVPLCVRCQIAVRPNCRLIGEMIDNRIMTNAAHEIGKADVVMVYGANFSLDNLSYYLNYYKGNNLILINEEEHYKDYKANLIVRENPYSFTKDLADYFANNDNGLR